MDSNEPKDTVISQSLEKGVEYEVTTEIVLEVSKGSKPPEVITKDVVIDLRGSAQEQECHVIVRRGDEQVYNATVPKGTASVTIPGQSSLGLVKYTVIINEHDGWDVLEEFSANG